MAIGLIVIAIGSFIAGAACVGIQLEKVKRQRDEARKQVKDEYNSGYLQGYEARENHERMMEIDF